MKPLRVGLIGAGIHGSRYAKHIQEDCPALALQGVARSTPEKAAQTATQWNCRAYQDYHELMADPQVDAVVSVVPPHEHAGVVSAAVNSGKPLLLEKPIALDAVAAESIHIRVQDTGHPLLMAQTMRLDAVVQTLVRELPRLGPIHALALGQQFEPEPREWTSREQTAGAGMLVHTGVHLFDLVWLFTRQDVSRVRCSMSRVGDAPLHNNYAAVLELKNGGALATLTGSRATRSRSGLIHLVGEKGQLLGDFIHRHVSYLEDRNSHPVETLPSVATVKAMLDIFENGIRKETAFPITTQDGLRAVALAEACFRSWERGEAVDPGEITSV